MFLGEHQHALDAKGRVILPARFREQLEGGAVMAKSLDGCLSVFPSAYFTELAERMREARRRGETERQAARAFFAGAVEVIPDKQGRVAIPPNLRDFAALDRDVVVSGAYTHMEIWDAPKFRDTNREGTALIEGGQGIDDFA